jgi:predicted metalloprotease with PDZ domain
MSGVFLGNVRAVNITSVTFDPAIVATITTAEQTVTVPGVKLGDVVFVSKPTLTAGLGIAGARVSADDTVAITFVNPTAAGVNAGSEVYTILSVRPEVVATNTVIQA